MKKAGIITLALVAAVAVAVPALGAGGGKKSPPKTVATVAVGDDYFAPSDLNFMVGSKPKQVKFKWAANDTDSHNVTLKKGPKSLTTKEKKALKSATGTSGKFYAVFKKDGDYKFICTIHPTQMVINVKVK